MAEQKPLGFVQVPAQAIVSQWIESFKEFLPRQKPASSNLDRVMERMTAPKCSLTFRVTPVAGCDRFDESRRGPIRDTFMPPGLF